MHFAHGVSVAVGAYLLLTLFSIVGLPFTLACLLTILLSGLFGVGMYFCIYLPLQKKKASNVILLIASIGLLILFENIIQAIFGAQVRSIGYVGVQEGIQVMGAYITPLQIVLLAVTLVLLIALHWMMQKTKLGRDMRAVANNRELASIVGINYKKIAAISFFIGSCLAGIAGILIGLEQNLMPLMGTHLMVRGFTGAVIGGITSVPGAILGSILLGLVENFGIWWLPSSWKDIIAFGVLFLFLLFKPNGLFGFDKGVKND
jgi:branched-chain amino acid transport system permease protein